MSVFEEPKENSWIRPVRRGYKIGCCDCGLVHQIDFKHIPWTNGRKIVIRVRRDARSTAMLRRWMTKKGELLVKEKVIRRKDKKRRG